MAQELIYTSFPKGVKPGVSGFCTVAVSPDMAPNMISRLEGLSGYRHLFMPGTPEADLNPPNWSHVVINVGNTESHVIYRVADAGLDYTGRSNKLAHFIVLDKNDQAPCGPAAMLTTPGLIDLTFDQQVGTRSFTRQIPRHLVSPRPCSAWRQAAGDSGWAGELAQTAWTGKYACIVYQPGMNVLALIQEAMALIPPERRWKTTFSTYYSKLPTGIDCQWRCVAAGTPEAAQAIAEVGSGLVIDLSNGALAPAADSPAVAAARVGRMVLAPAGAKSGGTAARQRPVQSSRPAADAVISAGIENELQAINSAAVNDLDEELLSAMDSAPQFTVNAQKKKTPQAAARKKYGLYAAILAGVFLIGIAVATYFVVTSGTLQIGNNTVAVNQANQDYDDEDETTDETDDEQTGMIPDSDQSAVIDQNAEPAPVTEPAPVSDQNQQPEGNSVNGSDKGESQPEQQNANTDQNAANVQSEADIPKSEPNADSEQQDEEKKKAELAKQKKEREKQLKQQKEAEEKIFNDPRWKYVEPKMYFIYVDSQKELDYTRLDLQLRKRNSPIETLQLISVVDADKTGMAEFKLLLADGDPNEKDIVYDLKNDVIPLCKIRLIKDEPSSENSGKVKRILRIEKEGDYEFRQVVSQFVFKATFADKKTQIISFLCEEDAKDEKKSSKRGSTSSKKVNQSLSEYINSEFKTISTNDLIKGEKTCLERNILEGLDFKKFKKSEIKICTYRDSVILGNKSREVKEYKIIESDVNRNSSSEYIIKVRIDFPFDLNEEKNKSRENKSKDSELPKKMVTINNLIVKLRTDNSNNPNQSDNRYYKAKFEFECEDDPNNKVNIELAQRDFGFRDTRKYYSNNELSNLVREILIKLPVQIEIYIEGNNSQGIEPFLWRQIVLPPPQPVVNPSSGAPVKGK
ncbi:MAG: hypothetical protein IKX40_01940 [Thermoguttaceae bacterium]|nr:hypothetical protein [Thermoguttaceae bacterium]